MTTTLATGFAAKTLPSAESFRDQHAAFEDRLGSIEAKRSIKTDAANNMPSRQRKDHSRPPIDCSPAIQNISQLVQNVNQPSQLSVVTPESALIRYTAERHTNGEITLVTHGPLNNGAASHPLHFQTYRLILGPSPTIFVNNAPLDALPLGLQRQHVEGLSHAALWG
jgi:hypothetical protein